VVLTEAYANVSKVCPTLIMAGWDALVTKGKTAAGREQIKTELKLCQAPPSADAAVGLGGWYQGAIETMVQYGYPYPTSFYNPVPGYPFRVACEAMVKSGTGLGALKAAAEVYYNYTGQAGPCFGFGSEADGADGADGADTVTATKLRDGPPSGWGYQTCTEVYQPMPTNGLYPAKGGDMMPASQPNKSDIFDRCRAQYGVVPRPDWEEQQFFGPNIGAGSNIFLSSGQIDPWSAAGIHQLTGAANPTIEFHQNLMGAHHLDIRASNPKDPQSVVDCRLKQRAAMAKWIAEWKANPPLPTN